MTTERVELHPDLESTALLVQALFKVIHEEESAPIDAYAAVCAVKKKFEEDYGFSTEADKNTLN